MIIAAVALILSARARPPGDAVAVPPEPLTEVA
jgi:hypothetical protein